jgi:hypothetical protein
MARGYYGSNEWYEDQIRELNGHLDSWHKHYRENWVPKENWVVVGSDGFAWRVVSEFGTNQNAADDYFLHCVEHASSEKGPLKIFRLEKRVGVVQIEQEIQMEAQSWERGF